MAMNPMQRKANNYLLIGVLVTLLITGSIIAILFMQLTKVNNTVKEKEAKMKKVYVVLTDLNSGDKVTSTSLKQVLASGDVIPANAVDLGSLSENTVAKIDLKVGTILTSDMISESNDQTTDSLRTQEYNMVILPTKLESGDYIDIRLKMPDGTDYIVVSKKQVDIPMIDGVNSADTIRIKVTEEEILLMSNAIVEAYWATGSQLYATTYVEPGLQESATPTYLPSDKVINLMNSDPNILTVAKNELFTRYNSNASAIRGNIVSNLNANAEKGQDNVSTKVQEEINKAKEERQAYLESL